MGREGKGTKVRRRQGRGREGEDGRGREGTAREGTTEYFIAPPVPVF